MDPMQIFCCFSAGALQPAITQRLLEASRKRLIGQIERERKSLVVLLVHRQETMSLLGFPVFRYIDLDDSEEVLRAIHMTDPESRSIWYCTRQAAWCWRRLKLRVPFSSEGKVTVFVPHYAMSGGTLIALAAKEIVMSEHAVLGPLDPQLGQQPAASILKVLHQKPIAEVDDHTLILADQAGKAVAQMEQEVREWLADKHTAEKAQDLAKFSPAAHGRTIIQLPTSGHSR